MRLKDMVSEENPLRKWGRRIAYSSAARPDIGISQLTRRLEVLEAHVSFGTGAQEAAFQLADLLKPYQFQDLKLVRVGSKRDGGYVLPDELLRTASGVVSLGVGSNNDADIEIAQRGVRVHAWDHTVNGLPRRHRLVDFHRQGVGQGSPALMSLDAICEESFPGVQSDLILMMDVEGAEWGVFEASLKTGIFRRFSVISAELHALGDALSGSSRIQSLLETLLQEFVPVALHANNTAASWNIAGLCIPDCLEVTLVRRDLLKGLGWRGNCSVDLVSPCCPDLPEVELSWA